MALYGPHDVFDDYPHLGFETGPTDAEKVYFVFTRAQDRPLDWQGGRDIIADRVPGGPRTLYMDMGAQPLRLETGLMFRNDADFRRFWKLAIEPGMLRMNANSSLRRGDSPDPVRISGREYVEFSNVVVAVLPTEVTFDLYGAVHCTVVFEREDTAWQ
jgi:hypothetical protein